MAMPKQTQSLLEEHIMNIIAKILLGTAFMISTGIVIANPPVNHAVVAPTTVKTIKQALAAQDETPVELRGHVVKAKGDEKYEFRDNSGVITVDIDDDLWQGHPIAANTVVTLIGKVDIDYKPTKRVEIDVDALRF